MDRREWNLSILEIKEVNLVDELERKIATEKLDKKVEIQEHLKVLPVVGDYLTIYCPTSDDYYPTLEITKRTINHFNAIVYFEAVINIGVGELTWDDNGRNENEKWLQGIVNHLSKKSTLIPIIKCKDNLKRTDLISDLVVTNF